MIYPRLEESNSDVVYYTVKIFDNLQSLEEKMGDDFFRSHRSYLLNKTRIRRIDLKGGCVEMDNGENCMLSRKAKKQVKEEMKQTI